MALMSLAHPRGCPRGGSRRCSRTTSARRSVLAFQRTFVQRYHLLFAVRRQLALSTGRVGGGPLCGYRRGMLRLRVSAFVFGAILSLMFAADATVLAEPPEAPAPGPPPVDEGKVDTKAEALTRFEKRTAAL